MGGHDARGRRRGLAPVCASDGSPAVAPGEFRITRVGDATDTSPYITDFTVKGVSTGEYIKNMAC